jgi:hypothetical protein
MCGFSRSSRLVESVRDAVQDEDLAAGALETSTPFSRPASGSTRAFENEDAGGIQTASTLAIGPVLAS